VKTNVIVKEIISKQRNGPIIRITVHGGTTMIMVRVIGMNRVGKKEGKPGCRCRNSRLLSKTLYQIALPNAAQGPKTNRMVILNLLSVYLIGESEEEQKRQRNFPTDDVE
jgi:hypothetical protein